jgi:hypothetical protein
MHASNQDGVTAGLTAGRDRWCLAHREHHHAGPRPFVGPEIARHGDGRARRHDPSSPTSLELTVSEQRGPSPVPSPRSEPHAHGERRARSLDLFARAKPRRRPAPANRSARRLTTVTTAHGERTARSPDCSLAQTRGGAPARANSPPESSRPSPPLMASEQRGPPPFPSPRAEPLLHGERTARSPDCSLTQSGAARSR